MKAEKNVDLLDQNEYTPLHWACYYGQLSSVQVLIDAGADVNKLAPDMVTPMLLAAGQGKQDYFFVCTISRQNNFRSQ